MSVSKDLNSAIIRSVTGKYSLYVFQLLSLAILSRLYTPEMFGVLAAVTVLILFFQLIATSGLGPAIIHCESISNEERDGIFSATLIIGVTGALLFIVLTPSLISWLALESIPYLSLVLAINIVFSALSMLPLASLQKDTRFLVIARAEIIAESTSLLIAVAMFYKGFGVLGLISKVIIVPICRFTFYYISSSKTQIGKPKFGSQFRAIFKLLTVAKYQLAFNVLNFFSRNLDTILITKYFGASIVGIYEKSYQVMRYPLQLFTFAITPALQPVLTKYKDNPEVVMAEFYRVAIRLACVGLFAALVLFWAANEVIFIMFGPQWNDTADILKILAVTIPLQMVLSATGGVYQAFGHTKYMFYCGVFSSFTNVVAIIFGVLSGELVVLCYYLTIAFSINFIQCFITLHKYTFRSFSILHFLVLIVPISASYFNLYFVVEQNRVVSESYLDAFIHCFYVTLCALAVVSSCYFIFKKFEIDKINLNAGN